MEERIASRDGTPIAAWRSGRGRPLVLVHGSTADHTRWDPLRPFLEQHVAPVALDRRGYGRSGDRAPHALEREAEDVAAVVEATAASWGGPVDLFGHSYGALCALEAALRTPAVRRLVLYEPLLLGGAGDPTFADRAEALLAAGRPEAVLDLLFREVLGLPEADVAAMRRSPLWRVRVAGAHALPREDRAERAYHLDAARLATLGAPTLLLLGSASPPLLRASTEAAAKALPAARIALLEGQEHLAISAAPGLVAEAVVPFLAPDGPAAGP
jgi:pimeloyl-ACP methyl ester carboxylesterase